jgi:hypothetical protein
MIQVSAPRAIMRVRLIVLLNQLYHALLAIEVTEIIPLVKHVPVHLPVCLMLIFQSAPQDLDYSIFQSLSCLHPFLPFLNPSYKARQGVFTVDMSVPRLWSELHKFPFSFCLSCAEANVAMRATIAAARSTVHNTEPVVFVIVFT